MTQAARTVRREGGPGRRAARGVHDSLPPSAPAGSRQARGGRLVAFWRYLGLGQYGSQIAGPFDTFPPEQVLLLRYRQLREEPAATLDRICEFLGVTLREMPAANVTAAVSRSARNRWLAASLRAGATVGPPSRRRGGRRPAVRCFGPYSVSSAVANRSGRTNGPFSGPASPRTSEC